MFLFALLPNASWRRFSHAIGLRKDDQIDNRPGIELHSVRPSSAFNEPKIESTSPYPVGKTKPAGSNYTKCLIVPKLREENTSWITDELEDMLDSGLLSTAIYVVDDEQAELHPPQNKGNEVMVYLSYIIDFYDRGLADVNIFMHAHRYTWHNNELLDTDAVQTVRRLSPERVSRDGYMNLRCHWDPGCPDWLHPGEAASRNFLKEEEMLVEDSWAHLFPDDPVPKVLAQPCCGQFAVSRDRIHALPRTRYVELRDWLLDTDLPDHLSGRVFEYIWQIIFSATPIHCPSMSACYCDGYGMCFGSPTAFDQWFELRYQANEYREELRLWRERVDLIKEFRQHVADGKLADEPRLKMPEPDRDLWLEKQIENVESDMERRRQAAFDLGRDPKQRALEAGRGWKDGDGF